MRLLEPSKTNTIHIQATVAQDLPLTASKFIGKPYLPVGESYPLASDGTPLMLLAQINFAELPPLDDYPTEGILQFYVHPYSDTYGVDFSGNYPENTIEQKDFRVVFHEKVQASQAQTALPTFDAERIISPVFQEHALQFSVGEEYVPSTDWRFEQYFGQEYFVFSNNQGTEELWRDYNDHYNSSGHKIGGYACFTQWDIRSKDLFSDYELLLQIDSTEADEICWGDVGVGNFFIRREDLRNRDFSKVLYTWDCC